MQNNHPLIHVLFEDNHVLILDKPHGLLTQPTDLEEKSLLTLARAFLKERDNKPGNVFLEPIHRIDKPVRGIVVFAKTSKALSRLMQAIKDKKCTKVYHATVTGKVPKKEGSLKDKLVHGNFRAELSEEGKESILHYKVIKKEGPYTYLEILLETGRYHQIRMQLSLIGCPIVGDAKYGSLEHLPGGAIALEHYKFSFPHPTTKEVIEITLKKN
jgi:23S rRNA pseudouridine1911/1915/1917 synthase